MAKKPSPYDDPEIMNLPEVKAEGSATSGDAEFDAQNPIVKKGVSVDPKSGIRTKHN